MTIDGYLRELEHALQAQQLPARRLLLEVEAHLRDATSEAGEEEAIARFGGAHELAARYAAAVGPRIAHRVLLAGAVPALALASLAVWFLAAAPPIVWDFPQGAPTLLLVQVAVVALGVGALHLRRMNVAAVARSVFVCALAVTLAALAEAALALARPAGFILWSEAPGLFVGFVATAVASLVATTTSVVTLRR